MSSNIQQNVGTHVRKIRKDLGLSKTAFALMAGISRVQLNLIEEGRANLKLSNLEQLANRLGVEPWELIQ